MARGRASITHAHTTLALVLRRVAYGESDLVVTLLTEQLGLVSAIARAARKSQRRYAGSLEPVHTLRVRLEERSTHDLLTLREASLEVARRRTLSSLPALEAAGQALAWVRQTLPPRTPEPSLWRSLTFHLDGLETPAEARTPTVLLAEFGLRLLSTLGWGIDFERCVVTGEICAPGRAAMVDATRGGLVSRAAGGARLVLDGQQRERLARAARIDEAALLPVDAELGLALVSEALRAHVGVGQS